MRIVFCGTGDIGLPALRALADSPRHDVVGLITQPDRPAGRDMRLRAPAVKAEALMRGIPVVQPERLKTDFSALAAWAPDLMVVAAYGQILSKAVLELPRLGCLNLHASLLPRHRGASPISAAMLAGDAETGITVMYVAEGLDSGDILLARPLPILPTETAGELHDRLAALAPFALLDALADLESGTASRTPQAADLATYASKLKKSDGRLDWRAPASALSLRVRAMSPWPGTSARLDGHVIKIHAAREAAGSGDPGEVISAGLEGVVVAAGAGSLALRELQVEGRKRLPAEDFLRGFPVKAGMRFDLSFSGSP
jgi:methionyl-tRNA formyltransferase